MKKRVLSILLTLCMVMTLLPTVGFAEGSTEQEVSNSDALLAAISDSDVSTVKLTADVSAGSVITLEKDVTLDLNGYVLSGKIYMADAVTLTLIDSRPDAAHSNGSFPKGGVLNGEIEMTREDYGTKCILYANGGAIMKKVSLNSYITKIYCTSDTPTAFKGYVGNYGEIHGGIYYDSTINTGCIKEKTVTFINGNNVYAREVVMPGNTAVEPVEPTKSGYTFDGWYSDDTKFDFSNTAVIDNLTLTAHWKQNTYTVTYAPGANGTGTITAGTKTDGVDFTLTDETFTRTGYVQNGWATTEGGEMVYELGGVYSENADVTLYPVWDEIITLEIPFTTTVEQTGNTVPGKTTFTLEIFDAMNPGEGFDDVTISGSVDTDGAKDYSGTLTITGPASQVETFAGEGFFVRQIKGSDANWEYSDAVYYAERLWDDVSILSDENGPAIRFAFHGTEYVDKMYIPLDGTVDTMSFVNTYSAHTHAYEQEHDKDSHWNECACGDVKDKEAHQFGEWSVIKEATETATGEKQRVCSVCGYSETAEIPVLAASDSPITGDSSSLTLWFALLFISGGAAIGTAVFSKKKKYNR